MSKGAPNFDGLVVIRLNMATYRSLFISVVSATVLPAEDGQMPRMSPFEIVLSKQEREVLERRARKYTLPYFEVLRAKMILLAAEGRSNDEIGASLDIERDMISLWRKRFFHERLPGLEE